MKLTNEYKALFHSILENGEACKVIFGLNALIRGKSDEAIFAMYKPVTNGRKLRNGNAMYQGLNMAMYYAAASIRDYVAKKPANRDSMRMLEKQQVTAEHASEMLAQIERIRKKIKELDTTAFYY